MLNLFLTALPLLGNYLFSQKNKKQSQQTIQTNQKRYEQKLSQLDSLFNRNYYSNILDRSDVRGLLGNLREQMSETTRNLKNKATITGSYTRDRRHCPKIPKPSIRQCRQPNSKSSGDMERKYASKLFVGP